MRKLFFRSISLIRGAEIAFCLSALTGFLFLLPGVSCAISLDEPLGQERLTGSFDTTLSYGLAVRTEERSPSIIGIAGGGQAYSVNNDDGDLNYSRGLIFNTAKATHDLGLNYGSFSAFARATYFVDFYNLNKDQLSEDEQDEAGRDFRMLDAYVRNQYTVLDRAVDLRVGREVVSWGESVYFQNGINIVNPVDLARMRVPGSELREALLPVFMASTSVELTTQLNLESFYQFEYRPVELEVCGTYFSTSDVACRSGSREITSGFGMVPSGTPGYTTQLRDDKEPGDQGQVGAALRYLLPALNDTEVALYFINYHSRTPILSAISTAAAPELRFEYPENIQLYGAGFNTQLGVTGIAFSGEYSFRPNQPLQLENTDLVIAASHYPAGDIPPAMPGEEVSGYRRMNVGQWIGSLSKSFGPANPFFADEWLIVSEAAVTQVYDFPDKSSLRFDGPGTDLPAIPIPGAPGVQTSGFADAFSWGYILSSSATYNRVIGAVNLTPRIVYAQDVNGTAPGPGGSFVEGRTTWTWGLTATYLEKLSADLSYTRFAGAAGRNYLLDRDYAGFNIKYSF